MRADPYVEGIAEAAIAHGDIAAAKALEAMLAFVIELLARLIGDDMAMKLIQRSLVASADSEQADDGMREKA